MVVGGERIFHGDVEAYVSLLFDRDEGGQNALSSKIRAWSIDAQRSMGTLHDNMLGVCGFCIAVLTGNLLALADLSRARNTGGAVRDSTCFGSLMAGCIRGRVQYA